MTLSRLDLITPPSSGGGGGGAAEGVGDHIAIDNDGWSVTVDYTETEFGSGGFLVGVHSAAGTLPSPRPNPWDTIQSQVGISVEQSGDSDLLKYSYPLAFNEDGSYVVEWALQFSGLTNVTNLFAGPYLTGAARPYNLLPQIIFEGAGGYVQGSGVVPVRSDPGELNPGQVRPQLGLQVWAMGSLSGAVAVTLDFALLTAERIA